MRIARILFLLLAAGLGFAANAAGIDEIAALRERGDYDRALV